MWSILSQVEQPWLRLMIFVGLGPLLWFALLAWLAASSAAAPALARIRRRAPRR